MHERHFMEHTLESLSVCLPPAAECRPHPKPMASLHRRPNTTMSTSAAFVDLHDDDDVKEKHETTPFRTNKRSHVKMGKEDHVYGRNHRKRHPQHGRESVGGDRPGPNPARTTHPPSVDREGSPSRPIRVISIATRCHSLDRDVFWSAHFHAANVPPKVPLPSDTPSDDMIAGLQRDRHAFAMRAANVARMSVKMDNPKPTLRPPIQPPGLFHLMPCGLLTFNLERDEFQAFEE